MPHYYVFNGDADGLCALQQLYLSDPKPGTLITGVKRDIQLLKRLSENKSDSMTVLDISLDKNRDALVQLLDNNNSIAYFDHHFAGEIPSHPNLDAHIDTAPNTCTSLIVNEYLSSAHPLWAIAGAFGDNFNEKATSLAQEHNVSLENIEKLKNLGVLINYNAYGATVDDLHFKPEILAEEIQPYANPLDFASNSQACKTLEAGYKEDLNNAQQLSARIESSKTALYLLPNAAWARRVSGVFANSLNRQYPNRAHALLTEITGGNYLVSIRAPKNNPVGADDLCRKFNTGGGRKAAAGINKLPHSDYDNFLHHFNEQFS